MESARMELRSDASPGGAYSGPDDIRSAFQKARTLVWPEVTSVRRKPACPSLAKTRSAPRGKTSIARLSKPPPLETWNLPAS